jgi:hypothetical protein
MADSRQEQRIMSALMVSAPAVFEMLNAPEVARKTLIEKLLSEGNPILASMLLKIDFAALFSKVIRRAGEVVSDVFDEAELEKLAEIAAGEEFKNARAAEKIISAAVSESIKNELESSKSSICLFPTQVDLEALKSYMIKSNNISLSGLKVGDKVVLGKHKEVRGNSNWSSAMGSHVGKTAKIIKMPGFDTQGCEVAKVDVDGGDNHWRTEDMTRASAVRSDECEKN